MHLLDMVEEKRSGDKYIFTVMGHKNDSSTSVLYGFSQRAMKSTALNVRENVKFLRAASVSTA